LVNEISLTEILSAKLEFC